MPQRQNAKQLRSNQTEAENRLWYYLRGRRLLGAKFKRQVPIGRYIVDFVCLQHNLVVEVDGGQHGDQGSYDERRDRWLADQGFRVLRFWNDQVLMETEAVLERIRLGLGGEDPLPGPKNPPLPNPLPQGRGDKNNAAAHAPALLPPLPQAGEGQGEGPVIESRPQAAHSSPLPPAGEGQGEGLAKTYSLYGLTIRSPLPLPAPLASPSANPDWQVHWAEPKRIPARPPRGRLLAEHRFNDTVGYAHALVKGDIVLRYFGSCEFRCDTASGRIAVHTDPRVPAGYAGYAGILLAGSVPASLLALAGETLLHASAVTVDGRAIAFVGYSGGGKSTLAAMACAVGARLLTDDVLRLDPSADALRCYGGANELRLRPKAAELAAAAAPEPPVETADGRVAIRPPPATENRPPLGAVVLPRPRKDQSEFSLRRLPAGEALTALLACPRVLGWRDHRLGANELPILARLVREVPVLEANIPWGPPFDLAHARALLREIDLIRAADAPAPTAVGGKPSYS